MQSSLKSALAALAFTIAAMPAFADAKTEAYVQKNASDALATLNDPALSADARTARFNNYMDQFTDMEAVARFTIGKYARRFSADEMARFQTAFRIYSLAVYENELDAYRGEAVVVKNSIDRSEKDSIVNTVIKRTDGKDMDVRWRVLTRNGGYQVVDVALNMDGNLIWLGIEQRAQFLALLDRNHGDADKLIAKIEQMTAKLEASKRS